MSHPVDVLLDEPTISPATYSGAIVVAGVIVPVVLVAVESELLKQPVMVTDMTRIILRIVKIPAEFFIYISYSAGYKKLIERQSGNSGLLPRTRNTGTGAESTPLITSIAPVIGIYNETVNLKSPVQGEHNVILLNSLIISAGRMKIKGKSRCFSYWNFLSIRIPYFYGALFLLHSKNRKLLTFTIKN
jgi:hypothetical protein